MGGKRDRGSQWVADSTTVLTNKLVLIGPARLPVRVIWDSPQLSLEILDDMIQYRGLLCSCKRYLTFFVRLSNPWFFTWPFIASGSFVFFEWMVLLGSEQSQNKSFYAFWLLTVNGIFIQIEMKMTGAGKASVTNLLTDPFLLWILLPKVVNGKRYSYELLDFGSTSLKRI